MGLFSSFQRFHEAGEAPNEVNTEQYGIPSRSLYTAVDLRDIHSRIEIKDEDGQLLYWTKSSIITIKGKTDIFDASGALVAHLEKKPISLHEKHFITMADGQKFTLSNELFHLFADITNIEGLGWQLKGNVIGLNFMLFDEHGEAVAAIGQKMISIHRRCSIDLYQPQHEKIVVAIVVQLQKMLQARENNRASSSDSDL